MFQRIGLWAVILSMLSGTANDLMIRLTGDKAYLYYVAFPLSMLAFIVCGSTFRGLRTRAGKMWLFLGVWMFLCIPFSVWRGGSWDVVSGYVPRIHLWFFMLCAFAITVRQCKSFMHFQIFSAGVILFSCVAFGGTPDNTGRFCIPGSNFFVNPNDLAIALVTSIGALVFLLLKKNWLLRAAGAGMLLLAMWFLLKTASRGAFLALIVIFIAAFIVSRARMQLILLLVPMMLLIPALSKDTLRRLVLIVSDPTTAEVHNENESATVGSQFERQHLFWMSLELTARKPIFGAGPGMFIEATSGEDQRHGYHSPALGTHNSYTQISSECGIPAFLCWAGVLLVSIRSMLRLYKTTRDTPALQDISMMAYSTFLGLVGFAAAAMFHHVAYTGYLATLGGTAVALSMAAEPAIARAVEARKFAPGAAAVR